MADLQLRTDRAPRKWDVLATIELKFALLRERVYVEKMEGLAWEESLVAEGAFGFLQMYFMNSFGGLIGHCKNRHTSGVCASPRRNCFRGDRKKRKELVARQRT